MQEPSQQTTTQPQKNHQQSSSKARSRLIRLPEVMDRIPLSRTSIYNRINDGTFPKPIKLGSKSVAWLESSIDEWIASHVEFSQVEEVQS